MKVTREKTENSQAFLTIEMEAAEVEESLAASYHHLAGRMNIPGFRKGKAPRSVVERYVGKEGLLEEAINHMLPEAYEKAVKEQNIEAIAQPQVEIAQTEPVIFKAVVPLAPAVTLGDYHDIQVKAEPVEVKEEDINTVMEGLRHEQATWEPVARPVEFGDLVTMDVESSVEGKPFLNQNGAQYRVLRDLASPVPGFAEQLPGIKKDEVKEFNLKFPDDYPREGFRSKEASFKVKVVEIKQERLPELNDELANQINPDFKTVASLREQVSTNLKLGGEERARLDFEERAVDAVVDMAQVEFPPVLVEMEIDRLISEQARRLQMDSRGLEEYLKTIKKTGEQLREDMRPMAQKRVTRSLVLDKVTAAEKIEVSDPDINTEIENIVKGAKEKEREELRKFLDTPQSRESIKRMLTTRKTIERLAEIARSAAAVEVEGKAEGKNEEEQKNE